MRILDIQGTASLGVPVPAWDPATSTPLHAQRTLGQRVRAWRKANRRVQLHHERAEADRLLDERRQSRIDESFSYSEPYRPEPAATVVDAGDDGGGHVSEQTVADSPAVLAKREDGSDSHARMPSEEEHGESDAPKRRE